MPAKTVILRRCIGSTRFGIESHEASSEEFPRQPSQKDGLGRMCKPHWNQYTSGLARDAKAGKAAVGEGASGSADTTPNETEAAPTEPAPKQGRRVKGPTAAAAGQSEAG